MIVYWKTPVPSHDDIISNEEPFKWRKKKIGKGWANENDVIKIKLMRKKKNSIGKPLSQYPLPFERCL